MWNKQAARYSDTQSVLHQIDDAYAQTYTEQDTSKSTYDISKKHFKDCGSVALCQQASCRKKFSLIDRPHHCYSCGNVYCTNCLQFKRKLNRFAKPDPDGRMYKVCQACFESSRNTEGCTRKRTTEFKEEKRKLRYKQEAVAHGNRTKSWRERFDFESESKRLKDGFKKSIGTSEMKRSILEMKSLLKTPEWQKSSLYMQENLAEKCQICHNSFGILQTKHNCVLCGMALCKSCSSNNLIIYLEDDRDTDQSCDPKLAIIRVIGAPEVEPQICVYLRVCESCREIQVERQVTTVSKVDEVPQDENMMPNLVNLQLKMFSVQEKLIQQLSDYQEIVESLEDNRSMAPSSVGDKKGKSNMTTLAKAQGDVGDYLTDFILLVQKLKLLKPQTKGQTSLMKNFVKSKCEFYLDNKCIYHLLKRQLSEASPPEVLDFIQKTVDRNAIISTQVYVRQLAYETIYLSDKYKLDDHIPGVLTKLDQVIENDVKKCLMRDKEDLDDHDNLIKRIVSTQMKEKKLIKPSRRLTDKQGGKHIRDVMKNRTYDILEQVKIQLEMKSAHRSFQETKNEINQSESSILSCEEDWVMM